MSGGTLFLNAELHAKQLHDSGVRPPFRVTLDTDGWRKAIADAAALQRISPPRPGPNGKPEELELIEREMMKRGFNVITVHTSYGPLEYTR